VRLLQVGFALKDLDRTVSYMKSYFGLEPSSCGLWPPKGRDDIKRYYKDAPSEFSLKIAIYNLGNIELEMIQPVKGESIYTDFIEEKGEGIHHIRFNVPDSESFISHMMEKGANAVQWGTGLQPGTQWVYFNTADTLGFITEIINTMPGTDGYTPLLNDTAGGAWI
jgi:methylmalonyl-CoA/ethylmalonyl-CoA epimerase